MWFACMEGAAINVALPPLAGEQADAWGERMEVYRTDNLLIPLISNLSYGRAGADFACN